MFVEVVAALLCPEGLLVALRWMEVSVIFLDLSVTHLVLMVIQPTLRDPMT